MSKTAIVVGGTRRVGRWVSRALLAGDYAVHAIYRADDAAARQCQQELAAEGHQLHLHRVDATDADEMSATLDRIAIEADGLDVLVNSVGPSLERRILTTRARDLEMLWRGNVLTAHNAIIAAMPYLRRDGGRIINFTSVGANRARAKQDVPAYAACKAMLESYSRSLAREVAAEGVTVNCIALGMTELPPEGAPGAPEEKLPMSASVSAADVAAVIGYLISPGAAQVTGTVINLSGGWAL